MKVGDRVRHAGFVGTVVAVPSFAGPRHVDVARDDGRKGGGKNSSWVCDVDLIRKIDDAPAVYVAGSQHERPRVRAVMAILKRLGCAITHDWTLEGFDHEPTEDEMCTYADLDIDGVQRADVLLVLTPERRDWGCGLWAELGIATVLKKRIVVVGPQRDRCVFALKATRAETDIEGVLRCCE